jgi:mRNA-degrading endonuclease RelE of RelBE toxin-antitoxin system
MPYEVNLTEAAEKEFFRLDLHHQNLVEKHLARLAQLPQL